MAAKRRRPIPESDLPWPTDGGRYLRDPETGELTRLPERGEKARPAAASAAPADEDAAGDTPGAQE